MPFPVLNLVIAAGLFILSEALKPKPKGANASSAEDLSVNSASYGSVINYVLGTAKISPVIVWYGDFRFEEIKTSNGSLFFKKSSVTGYKYFLSAQEVLCTGPIQSLNKIWFGEELKWQGSIGLGSSWTSGTINLNNKDTTYYLTPGTTDQQKVPKLLTRITPQTSYPYICFLYWDDMFLGDNNLNWPNNKYEVTRYPDTTICDNGAVIIYEDDGNQGINPAFAILSLLTDPLLGNTIPITKINIDSLNVIAKQFQTEKIYLNFAISDLTDRETIFNEMFNTLGILCYEDENGLLTFTLIRETSDYKLIESISDSLLVENPKIKTDYYVNQVNDLVYQFKDKNFNYTDRIIALYDTGSMYSFVTRKQDVKTLNLINNQRVAERIIRIQKSLVNNLIPSTDLKIIEKDIAILPGMVVRTNAGNWRVLEVKEDKGILSLGVVKDSFYPLNIDIPDEVVNQSPDLVAFPIKGLASNFWLNTTQVYTTQPQAIIFEMPWEANISDSLFLGIVGVKPKDNVINGVVLGNKTDNTYKQKTNNFSYANGAKVVGTTTTGIYVTTLNNDFLFQYTAPIDDNDWNNNRNIFILNGEFISLKVLETSTTGNYFIRFDNLKRGRLSSEIKDPVANDILFFTNNVTQLEQDVEVSSGNIYIKVLTQTNAEILSEQYTNPMSTVITNIATKNLPVDLTALRSTTNTTNITINTVTYAKSSVGKVATTTINNSLSINNSEYTTVTSNTVVITTNTRNTKISVKNNDSIVRTLYVN